MSDIHLSVVQFGAGDTWTPIKTYKWKGIAGKWEGWDAIMTPQVRVGE